MEIHSIYFFDMHQTSAAKIEKHISQNITTIRNSASIPGEVLSGRYAGYLLYPILTHLPEYKDCKVQTTGFFVNKADIVFALQKNSSLTKMFNRGLLEMINNGELQRLLIKHKIVTKDEKHCEQVKKGTPIGLENILSIFIALGLRNLIAILIFLLEICIHSLINRI